MNWVYCVHPFLTGKLVDLLQIGVVFLQKAQLIKNRVSVWVQTGWELSMSSSLLSGIVNPSNWITLNHQWEKL